MSNMLETNTGNYEKEKIEYPNIELVRFFLSLFNLTAYQMSPRI